MSALILVRPCGTESPRLDGVLAQALAAAGEAGSGAGMTEIVRIADAAHLARQLEDRALCGQRILFAAALDGTGIDMELMAMLAAIRSAGPACLAGSICACVVDGVGELYTKQAAREIVFTANMAGCTAIGRPLAEGTGSLANYRTLAGVLGLSLMETYEHSAADLVRRLMTFSPVSGSASPELLCLHASEPGTSNTLRLWDMVRTGLPETIRVRQISLRAGTVRDCRGCAFETCLHFAENASCYYGGAVVEEVYPALLACDALVLLCPNYNDAPGADITAMINRLTALYRQRPFDDKYLFALIVSGYSGSDIVARQLAGSLNMNKSFILPGHFALTETAYLPGSIDEIPGIHEEAARFGAHIGRTLGLPAGAREESTVAHSA